MKFNEHSMPSPQGKYWLLTIPKNGWSPPDSLPQELEFLSGQLERGEQGGFEHWQVLACFVCKKTCRFVCDFFGGSAHAELTRSDAARAYVHKDDTYIEGTRFEFGSYPVRRNSRVDWDAVWTAAKSGEWSSLPSSVLVQHYRTLRTIRADYAEPSPMERQVFVFCGTSGAGKSRRAWEEATFGAYPKDPRSKFWDGYRDQEHVVIDEFRGGIDISHILRWFDRYPVLVEIKGSSCPLVAKKIWVTSNIHPRYWYPDLDPDTRDALLRRLQITEFE